MREQIIRYAHVPPGVVGHGAVRISIPVIHEGVRITGVQAVVASGVFFIGVQRRRRDRRSDGLRCDLLLGCLYPLLQSADCRRIRFQGDGRAGLLEACVHFGFRIECREINVRAARFPSRAVPALELIWLDRGIQPERVLSGVPRCGARHGNLVALGNLRQQVGLILLILLTAAHRGNDGVFGELQFSGADSLAQCVHIRLVRFARHHKAQVGVGRDVHGVQGIDGRFAGKQRVHVQIGGDQGADDGVIAENVLHIQRLGSNTALDDFLAAVDAQVGHIVIGYLLEGGYHISAFVHGNGIEMPVLALDHQLAHRQGDHVCFGHSQLCDIQFARCALRDDGCVGGQVLDMRPIDVGGSNISLHHAGHSS